MKIESTYRIGEKVSWLNEQGDELSGIIEMIEVWRYGLAYRIIYNNGMRITIDELVLVSKYKEPTYENRN
jgi:hypothetical protein